jgi:hypothetical protein
VGTERQYRIYPGDDHRVVRVVRKVVRGLCHYFGIASAIADRRVFADVPRGWDVPSDILDSMQTYECEREIFHCRYQLLIGNADLHSVWLLTFFENKTFFALVSASTKGFPKDLKEDLRGKRR